MSLSDTAPPAGPVQKIPLGPQVSAWLVTRYDDARRALLDPRLAKSPLENMRMGGALFSEDLRRAMNKHMLAADPPDHTRLRKLVSAAFTPRRMESMRGRVTEISDALLDSFEDSATGRDEVDLIDNYAFPLPFQVICELIGVPKVDRDSFRAWSNTLIAGFGQPNEASFAAAASMAKYCQELVRRKRSEPDDALLSGLIEATDAGDRLDEDELTSLIFLLLVAGHETTVNLIGNAMYLLLKEPAQAEALRRDPSQLAQAIEDVLRLESPVQTATFRMATEPVEFGEVTIPAGEVVLVSLQSANLDAGDAPHIAFGHGIHFCLGAPLARIEGQIAIGSLLTRFPAMQPAVPIEKLEWRPGILLRGLAHLPVRLRDNG
jgi:cytochrome P450